VVVVAKTSFPDTAIAMYLDDEKIQDGYSDQDGDVTMYIS
jgi:hypothetical protein